MSTENTEVAETTETQVQTNNALQEAAFGDDNAVEQVVVAKEPQTVVAETEKTFDKEWLKKEFDTDDVAVLKAEREELKTLREKSKDKEFANEDSRKFYDYIKEGKEDELYKFISDKKKVEKLLTADISDKNIASDIVKFGLQKDNPTLSEDEVEFLFNEKYSVPSKPTQGDLEDDTEYQERLDAWEVQAKTIEKRLIIEAKVNQPKMAQFKTDLVLPNIPRENQEGQPTQEDLDAIKKNQESFLLSAEKTVNEFNGFSLQVKDKDVDYTVSYSPSQEERTFVNSKIKDFAESGFNANAILADRWVSEDGKSVNIDTMVKDLSRIYGDDKISQKLVVDAANKRLETYLKDKKQISVNGQQEQGTFSPTNNQSEMDKVREEAFA